MNQTLYAFATAAVSAQVDARNAHLQRAVADTGVALLAAVRAAYATALPARPDGSPDALQPLADLLADCAALTTNHAEGLTFDPRVIELLNRAEDNTGRSLQMIQPHVVRSKVRCLCNEYESALRLQRQQAARLAE